MTIWLPPLYAVAMLVVLVFAVPVVRTFYTLAPRFAGLVCDGAEVSNTKTITIGTWVAATVIAVRSCWSAGASEGVAVVLVTYVGLFVANSVASRAIAAKWGAPASSSSSTTTETTVAKTETIVAPGSAPISTPTPSPGGPTP